MSHRLVHSSIQIFQVLYLRFIYPFAVKCISLGLDFKSVPLPPPIACAFASFKVFKKTPKARTKIARSLYDFCTPASIKYGGYVRRLSNEELEVLLVLDNYPQGSFEPVWKHLKSREFAKVGSIAFDSFQFEQNNYTNAQYLDYSFKILTANGGNEGWSIFDEGFAEEEGYSLVSSLR